MNKTHRLIWNDLTRTWVAVSEHTKARGKRASGALLLAGLLLAAPIAPSLAAPPNPPAANQLPTGGKVVAGQAGIAQSGATLNINQSSNRAAIDWATFNVGRAAQVNFNQPGTTSVTLNRVLDSNPSQIFGRVTAPGQIFFTNPNGAYFAPGASVEVGGLVATTHSIGNAEFMAGGNSFSRNGATGSIVNEGKLTASLGGYIALLAPEVRNGGLIFAQMGTVALAAGEVFELQFDANNTLASLRVSPATLAALVENGNAVQAPGGLVILSARAADQLQGSVVRNSGSIEAGSLVERGGRIVLTGDHITLASGSKLDASGASGGGEVLVGGGWQGSGGLYQATTVTMEQGASIDVSATKAGDGGKVVLWSDVHNAASTTQVYGTVLAKGGANGGDGGAIETSGHRLDVAGITANASAPKGKGGEWLLDPYNITISSSADSNVSSYTATNTSSNLNVTTLTSALNNGTSVTVQTGGAIGTGSEIGDITVNAAISKTGSTDSTLTLKAHNNVVVSSAISSANSKLNINLLADSDKDGAGIVIINSNLTSKAGDIAFGDGSKITFGGVANTQVGGDVYVTGSSAVTWATGGGSLTVNGQTLIGNTSGLTINTANGAVTFNGSIDSANQYTSVYVSAPGIDWTNAVAAAKSGTGTASGDTYLATVTSRLENSIASQTVGYQDSWLGGRRVTGIGTDTLWRWVTGPEAAMDGGKGLVFSQQNISGSNAASGATSVNGYFNNWAPPGEPNNWNSGASGAISTEYESVLQFTGSLGKWNDLPKTVRALNYYVKETNALPSPLNINAGTGALLIQGGVGSSKALASLNVTSGSTTVNGNGLITTAAQTYSSPLTVTSTADLQVTATTLSAAGPISLSGANVNLNANLTSTGSGAGISVLASGNIVLTNDLTFTTNDGNVLFASDTDGSGGGNFHSNGSLTVNTTGAGVGVGNITIGGGTSGTGYAQGVNTDSDVIAGVLSYGAVSLASGGGDISIKGKSSTTAVALVGLTPAWGVGFNAATTINSGTGKVTIDGVGQSASASGKGYVSGVVFNLASGTTSITSGNTTADAITITGSAATAGNNLWNLGINSLVAGSSITATGSGGGITLNGTRNAAGHSSDIYLPSWNILAKSGAINISGLSSGGTLSLTNSTIGSKTGTSVLASSSNITINADAISASGLNINSTGTLTVQPFSTSFASALTWQAVTSGLTGLTLGTVGNLADIAVASTQTIAGPITIYGGNIALNAGLTANGTDTTKNTITLKGSGSITQTAAVTAANLALLGGNVTLSNASNNIGTLAASGVSDLTYVNSSALTIGTVNSTSITATGKVSISTLTGHLTVANNISTTNATADTTFGPAPTTAAVMLNAGTTAAAGTAAGGNIIISGSPLITVGVGGTAKLFSGSILDSTGLAALVGTGSGRFRYDSDEAASNFTRVFGAGLYAIFREQPAMAVTAADKAVTYGNAPVLTSTVTGIVNGDASAVTMTVKRADGSTTPTTVNGGLSTSSNYQVGEAYKIAVSTGNSELGYASNVTNGTLTVSAKPLTASYIAANRSYDGTDTASVTGSLSAPVYSDVVTLTESSKIFDTKNVGTVKTVSISGIALDGADKGNYTLSSVTTASTTASISKANLVFTTDSVSKVYDGSTTGAGAVTIGSGTLFSGDTRSGGTVVYANKNAGTGKTLTVSGETISDGNSGGNYNVSYSSITNGVITAKPLTLAGSLLLDKTYDGTLGMPSGQNGYESLAGVVGSDAATITGAPVYSSKDAGSRAINKGTVALKGAEAGNYSLGWTDGSGTIGKATLTATANDDAKFVTQADPSFGLSVSGFVNGETTGTAAGYATPMVARTGSGSAAGTYNGVLVASGGSASNYSFSPVAGNFTIVPADQLLMRVTPVSSAYGATTTYSPESAKYLKSTDGAGTITTIGTAVTGTGTSFTSLSVGDILKVSGVYGRVAGIADVTHLTLASALSSDVTIGSTFKYSREVTISTCPISTCPTVMVRCTAIF